MRWHNSTVAAELIKSSFKPVTLYEIDVTGTTLRYAASKDSVTFPSAGGNVYTPRTILHTPVKQFGNWQIDRITLHFDDISYSASVDRHFWELHKQYDFYWKNITIKRVFRDILTSADYYEEVFYGWLERPKWDGKWMIIDAVAGMPLERQALTATFGKLCPFQFSDSNTCQYTLVTGAGSQETYTQASVTSDSSDNVTLISTTLSANGEANDFWNYGEVIVYKTGYAKRFRTVQDFTASSDTITLDAPLPFTPLAADTTFTIRKGCDKTWACCGATLVYGPSTSNRENYRGFRHVPYHLDGRITA